jgi:iron complex outermembrane recepter protein
MKFICTLTRRHTRRAAAAAVVASVLVSGQALAEADATSQPELAEIVVTAQKRSQNLQDVPVMVQVLSAQEIQNAGVTDIKNLAILTPGLTVTSSTSENSTSVRIRGIGTVSDNVGLESSVGIVIDGVYRPRNGVGFENLGEIERIEVLEGPQGTLFGKNNDAGVINVITKKPSMTFGVSGDLTVGNYNDKEIEGSVTGPVSANSAVRLYAGFEKRDGFLAVDTGAGPSTDNNANNRNAYTTRGQYLITPSDNVSFLMIADFSKRNEVCCDAVPVISGVTAPLINILASTPALGGRTGVVGIPTGPVNPFSYYAYANGPASQQIRDMGVSGQLDWVLGPGTLTSITAWRDNTIIAGNDVEYTAAPLAEQPATQANQTDFKQFSEEVRYAGKTGPLQWLVGAFYSDEIIDPNLSILAGPQLEFYIAGLASASAGGAPNPLLISQLTGNPPGGTYVAGETGEADWYHQTSKSYAFFSDETYSVTPKLDLTAGVRYTKEKKTATSNFSDPDGGAACGSVASSPGFASQPAATQGALLELGCATVFNPFFNGVSTTQSLDEDKVTGTFKVSYRFTDDVMGYGSWANGYKAGGFNLARVADSIFTATPLAPNFNTQFPDETVNSYEIGIKSTLAQKTVRLNVAAFDQQYHDFQLNTYDGFQYIVSTIPRVSSAGVDVDSAWATPLRGFTLAGGVTYAFTNIREFGSATLFDPDRLNNRLSFAPMWSGSLSATYQAPITQWLSFLASVTEKYNSSYNTDSNLAPSKLQPGYGIINARIGVGAPDGKWAVELWSANLADKGYYQVAFDAPFQVGQTDAFLGDPRTFGITFRTKL